MGDVVVLVLVVGVFLALVGFVALCDRIVGPPGGGEGSAAPAAEATEEVDRVVR
jgi:hypothetical protein